MVDVIGEVIESSTQEFVAESKELHSPPPFGCFVKVGMNGADASLPLSQDEDPFAGETPEGDQATVSPATYAIVYQATTTPVDTGRKLRAYWKTEEELNEVHPEVSEWLLVTNFRAVIIGHRANGMMCQFLPPQPPKLLTRVHICKPDEIRRLTSRMDFLRTLTNFSNAPTEEVIAACIREAFIAHNQNFDFLVAAGKELAGLLKDDYDRLQAIMRRVAP